MLLQFEIILEIRDFKIIFRAEIAQQLFKVRRAAFVYPREDEGRAAFGAFFPPLLGIFNIRVIHVVSTTRPIYVP